MPDRPVFQITRATTDALHAARFQTFDPTVAVEGNCPACGGADLTARAKIEAKLERQRGTWVKVTARDPRSRKQQALLYRVTITCPCGVEGDAEPPTFVSPYDL